MADMTSSKLCEGCKALFSLSRSDEPPPKRLKVDEESDLRGDPENIPKQDRLCQHCLGLLDSNFQESVLQRITDHLKTEKYVGIESFQLCICTTPSLLMQHGAMLKWMTEQNSLALSDSNSIPNADCVKENIKRCLIEKISVEVGLKPNSNSAFRILLEFRHQEADKACETLVKSGCTAKKPKKNRKRQPQTLITVSGVQNAIDSFSYNELHHMKLLPFQTNYTSQCSIVVSFSHDSIYLAGRYNKYSRALSQTPWILDGVRKADTSVQDLIYIHLQPALRCETVRFSSSGREDVDVRMLGSGRPFLLELLNPKVVNLTNEDYQTIQSHINTSTTDISVQSLCVVSSNASKILKIGEENKKKTYSALVWSSQPVTAEQLKFLDDIRDLKIAQKTPIRVLHRRSLATRERTIYSMCVFFIDDKHFKLDLVTEAGTYIKEFIHGDFGRTVPNMCTLLGHEADILALDVTDLELEWPPKL